MSDLHEKIAEDEIRNVRRQITEVMNPMPKGRGLQLGSNARRVWPHDNGPDAAPVAIRTGIK